MKLIKESKRISYMDGYELYPEKFVLLGYTEDYADKSGIESGVVLAVGDSEEKDAMWDLFVEYLKSEGYGELYLTFYGNVCPEGVVICG